MPRRLPLLCAALVAAIVVAPPARATDAGALAAAVRLLQDGVSRSSSSTLLKARGAFMSLLAAEPEAPQLRYWVAVTAWRVVPVLTPKDKAKAERLCIEGLDQCEAALKKNPKFAEVIALKAGLMGLSIGFHPDDAMTIGPQMEGIYALATRLEPNNPRIRLIEAINTLHKPDFVGGGPVLALEAFKHAQKLYEAESVADSTAPSWGRADAYLWAGRASMQIKNYEAARDYYRKALRADPDYQWVSGALLPEAEQAIAAKEKP
jgi:tetratricopeptide (TPR) repeat protein